VSDRDPHENVDPTRIDRPVPDEPPSSEPTSVIRPDTGRTETVDSGYEMSTPPGRPTRPSSGGGVSTGVAIVAAITVGLLGLLAGYLVWGTQDDVVATAPQVEDTAPPDLSGIEDLTAERDEFAQQVQEQATQIERLQTELDEVTAERDELQEQLDEGGGEDVTTVQAPDVVDLSLEEAEQAVSDAGLELVARHADDFPEDAAPGTVVAQQPEPGTELTEGSVVVVDVVPEPEG
jgi:uncharacterized protein HemX